MVKRNGGPVDEYLRRTRAISGGTPRWTRTALPLLCLMALADFAQLVGAVAVVVDASETSPLPWTVAGSFSAATVLLPMVSAKLGAAAAEAREHRVRNAALSALCGVSFFALAAVVAVVRVRAEAFSPGGGTGGEETAILVALMLATGLLSFVVSLSKGDRGADRRADATDGLRPGWEAEARFEEAKGFQEALCRYARDAADARRRLVREKAEFMSRAQIIGLIRDPADAALATLALEGMEDARRAADRKDTSRAGAAGGAELGLIAGGRDPCGQRAAGKGRQECEKGRSVPWE